MNSRRRPDRSPRRSGESRNSGSEDSRPRSDHPRPGPRAELPDEVLYGVHPVMEALQGNRPFERIVLPHRDEGSAGGRVGQIHRLARERGIPVHFAPMAALDRLAGGERHQGVVAVLAARQTVSLDQILAGAPEPGLLVLADGVQDPRNLGAIVRTAAAAGAAGVVIPIHGACGLTPAVAKASAGALEVLPVAREGNIAEVVVQLKEKGWWVVGLDARGGELWTDPDYSLPTALVVGGEEGLRELVRHRCDRLVRLPLAPGVESLNVSVAAGIVLYEVRRQRSGGGGAARGKKHAEGR